MNSYYLGLKSAHIFFVMLWMSGSITIPCLLLNLTEERSQVLKTLRAYDEHVTTPAMLMTWTLGLWMSSQAQWWVFGWWRIKVALVLILSGLHGMNSGRLRRLCNQPAWAAPIVRWPIALHLAAMLAIIALVIYKPR
jgi:putative membrane protein